MDVFYIGLKILLFSIGYLLIYLFFERYIKKLSLLQRSELRALVGFGRSAVRVILATAVVLTVLHLLNIEVQSVVASLGLLSFALGLALKDIIGNALAGLTIIIYGPFKVGDMVSIGGDVEGLVKKIEIRYTTIQTDGKICLVPNSLVSSSNIFLIDRKEDKHIRKAG